MPEEYTMKLLYTLNPTWIGPFAMISVCQAATVDKFPVKEVALTTFVIDPPFTHVDGQLV